MYMLHRGKGNKITNINESMGRPGHSQRSTRGSGTRIVCSFEDKDRVAREDASSGQSIFGCKNRIGIKNLASYGRV